MVSRIVRALVIIALAVYPLIVYFGLSLYSFQMIGGLLLGAFCLRLLLTWRSKGVFQQQKVLAMVGIVLIAVALLSKEQTWFKLYPLLVNLVLLAVFALSLRSEQPMIEKFARLGRKNIPAAAKPYFMQLTKLWMAFFMLNATVSAWTIFMGSIEAWTLYNGFISYILMGCLLIGEWLYRKLSKLEQYNE
ncbi:hypothetical protein [Agarivorans sp. JK6]|uniref:COG4648 family protein n=1 Tax=Agarivorans sp. JK6 TaxID=2997426 RepID=UPI003872E2ED